MKPVLLPVLLLWPLAFTATPASAGCTEADLNRAAAIGPSAWARTCQQCGGHVTQGGNNRCEGFQSSDGGAPNSSPVDLNAMSTAISNAMREREAEVHRQHQQTMQNMDAQNRTRLSDEQQQVEAAKAGRQAREEQKRQDALSRMGAATPGSAIPAMDFKDYRKRQVERADALGGAAAGTDGKRVLSKAEQTWCKLHVPLKPTASIHAIEGQDEERMAIYQLRQAEWDQRCAAAPAPAAETAPPAESAPAPP